MEYILAQLQGVDEISHPKNRLACNSMYNAPMKCTQYFLYIRQRPDRALIQDEWIERAVKHPVRREIQSDGRIRCWVRIPEMNNRALRVILLEDGETVHNAFFDRNFKE